MKEGNDGSLPKDRGLVTKGKRGFDVIVSGVMGLKLSDQMRLVADNTAQSFGHGRRPQ